LGKDERHERGSACQEKGSAHARRAKEAFPVNESSLGGKKKSRTNKKSLESEKGRAYICRPKETFRTNESALGSQEESRLEISNCGHYYQH
jgi:hypothetical protein